MKRKCILFDIDGTLLNSEWKMPPNIRTFLKRLHDAGNIIGIDSGRPVQDIEYYVGLWELGFQPDLYIGYNGCEVKNCRTGVYHEQHLLTPEQLEAAITTYSQFDCVPFIYEDGTIVSYGNTDEMKMSAIKSGRKIQVTRDMSRLWIKPNAKVMYRTEDLTVVPAMEAYAAEHPIEGVQGFKTQPTLFETTSDLVSKAAPLDWIKQQFHLNDEDIIACGDTSNDNEILQAAHIGICLKNGSADTKAIADEITEFDNDHDGLLHHFETYYPELLTPENV
jgi:hypothetical protein